MNNALIDVGGGDLGFLGTGEMARLIGAMDWSATPLGPISLWSPSLRTTVSLCLASNFPINIIWGSHNTQIYNDGYRVVCGDKHPAAMGMDYTACWASAWPKIGPPFEQAMQGLTSFLENQRMFLFRNGYLEETFFTYSLSPIRDETGAIGGLFHPVTETTATMVGERRARAVRDLTLHLADAHDHADLAARTIAILREFDLDLPFVLLYLRDGEQRDYKLAGSFGVASPSVLAPPRIDASSDGDGIWRDAVRRLDGAGNASVQVDGLRARIGDLACGPYDEAPAMGFVAPLRHPGADGPVALFVTGASPRLPMNEPYRSFVDLIAAAFGAALSRVTIAEEERRRLDMLAAIDRAKTVFFSNVSHEFRTPLTLMLGPLDEALAMPQLAPPLRERLDIANRNAMRLLKLVNSLLDFSRIEAGRIEAQFTEVDLGAYTADLASNFRSACERAGLSLRVDCAALAGPFRIDRDMWEKIVLNLLSNAFKFTFTGSIHVQLRPTVDGAELRVADTGVGIASADLPRIFERFHRVEGQAGRSVEGSGIGLSLVRELVHLLGGEIRVRSEAGRGTEFIVNVPSNGAAASAPAAEADPTSVRARAYLEEALRWLPDEAAAVDAMEVATPAEPAALPTGRRGHIVLADDNADMRAYVRRVLEEAGFEVQAVGNGAAALDTIKRGPLPDMLVSDVMMPGLDGFALLAALRGQAATRELPVLLLSARAGEEARVEALQAGADDYIVKPFNARELVARIEGAVNMTRQRRQAASREQSLLDEIEIGHSRAALAASSAQVDSIFAQNAVGVVESDRHGRIVRANARFGKIVGRPLAELIGQPGAIVLHPDDAAATAALLAGMQADGAPRELDVRYLRPDGATVWVTMALAPVLPPAGPGDGGAAARILTVVLDITDRKQAESALREADARKDDFLAMLAHELRNPLAPITAAADLMGMVKLDPARLQQTSKIITRQVRHMTALVDDLLDVSRVTRGLIAIERRELDFNGVIASAIEQARPLIAALGHHLQVATPPGAVLVSGDHKRLVQVVSNLLNNAAKYTPPGGHLGIALEADREDVVLRISDDGIGIAADLQERVFELFAQAERTPDRSQGGLGLGLALVKNMVELHGGEVRCDSAGAGQGSTFTVRLPRSPLDATLAPAQKGPPHHADAKAGALRVMIVDDNEDAATMLGMLLENGGHAISIEHAPHPALARARAERPDVCILDIGLPGMDGNELARHLRADPATRDCTLIALTGYGLDSDRKASMDAGFDYFFAKPIDVNELAAVLRKVR